MLESGKPKEEQTKCKKNNSEDEGNTDIIISHTNARPRIYTAWKIRKMGWKEEKTEKEKKNQKDQNLITIYWQHIFLYNYIIIFNIIILIFLLLFNFKFIFYYIYLFLNFITSGII